jgi:hemerythrin-like domain-containing protein
MTDEQPGLRPRLAHATRRLAAQHQYLDALLATTRRALERNAPGEAREALHAFRGAIDAHFALEEQVHFPALHGLDPAQDREIEALVLEHRALREQLLALEVRVGREPRDAVARSFVDLGATLRAHESREERLVDAILGQGAG